MSNDQDPYELNDDPFADNEPDAASGDDDLEELYELDEPSDLDELAAAVHDNRPHAIRGERAPRTGTDGRLDEDIHCRSCGYNLRGLDVDGHCSECGTPVHNSLGSNNLRYANFEWLRSVYTGASFLSIGTLCLIPIGCVAGGVTSLFSGMSASGGGMASSQIFAEAVGNLINSVGGLIVSGYGTWKLCQPEPGVPGTPADSLGRPIARWTVLPASAFSVFLAFFYFIPVPDVIMAVTVVDGLMAIPAAVGFVASLIYLRRLARRIPDASLASQIQIVMWGMIGTVVLAIPALALLMWAAIGSSSPSGSGLAAGGVCFCGILLGFVVFGIWWLVIMFRFRSAFDRAMRSSKRTY